MVLQRIFSAAMWRELIWAEQLGLEEGDQIWGHLDRMAVRVERWDCFGVQPVVRFQERKLSPLFSVLRRSVCARGAQVFPGSHNSQPREDYAFWKRTYLIRTTHK